MRRENAVTPRKFGDPNWADVALKHCKDLYQTLYRLVSADGTYTTINAIHRHVAYDANQKISELKVGPDTSSLIETLMAACLMLIWAADPFARAFDLTEITARLQQYLRRSMSCRRTEPARFGRVFDFDHGLQEDPSLHRVRDTTGRDRAADKRSSLWRR